MLYEYCKLDHFSPLFLKWLSLDVCIQMSVWMYTEINTLSALLRSTIYTPCILFYMRIHCSNLLLYPFICFYIYRRHVEEASYVSHIGVTTLHVSMCKLNFHVSLLSLFCTKKSSHSWIIKLICFTICIFGMETHLDRVTPEMYSSGLVP